MSNMHLGIVLLGFVVFASANTCVPQDKAIEVPFHRPTRWAIVCLAKPGSEYDKRNNFLARALQPYASQHSIDILFFSELEFNAAERLKLNNTFRDIGEVRVINTFNDGFNLPQRFGYKYMCRFFTVEMYKYLADYDYYMRIDTDCHLQPFKYDVFQWVEENKVQYGYLIRKYEVHKETLNTLPSWISNKYTQQCHVSPTLPHPPLSTVFNFYNNFHIGDVRFFRRPDVWHFLSKTNSSGGILNYRWGDSTIQAFAVRLFMSPKAVRRIPDFEYRHGSHSDRLVSSVKDGKTTQVPSLLPLWDMEENEASYFAKNSGNSGNKLRH